MVFNKATNSFLVAVAILFITVRTKLTTVDLTTMMGELPFNEQISAAITDAH